jgi:pimeloyl-ACP methyl ester carboxylesterase
MREDGKTLPIVILGGMLSWPGLYDEMSRTLGACSGARVSVVDANPVDWLRAVSRAGWSRILEKLDREVRRAAGAQSKNVVVIGHSAGGVIARLYLSPEPFRGRKFAGLERVAHLVTLGSPNTNQVIGRMRRWVDGQYPGAFFAPTVGYASVAGRLREGRLRGTAAERAAYSLYRKLGGDGATWGDGLVPVSVALLPGARTVVLDGVGHGPVLARRWYGTGEVVRAWWTEAAVGGAR